MKLIRSSVLVFALALGMISNAGAQTSTAAFGPVTYLHNDVTGDVIVASDPNGAALWEERYLPYGAKRLGSGGSDQGGVTSSSQRYGFHNKSLDPETGLQYFGGRYYDPLTGRFSAMDPAPSSNADIYTFNRYAFANGNPYTYTDPSGRNLWSIVAWYQFGRDTGGLLVTEMVYTTAVIRGDSAVANMALDDMRSQRTDAALSTIGLLSPIPTSGGMLKAALRLGEGVAKGGVVATRIGEAGEAAVRAAYNIGPKEAIEIAGRTRFPDGLTRTVLSEVKNTASVRYTQQLRDFAEYARAKGLRFDLYVRPGAELSGPLRAAEAAGDIRILEIPH
jgi:RHS repeat-associated protein